MDWINKKLLRLVVVLFLLVIVALAKPKYGLAVPSTIPVVNPIAQVQANEKSQQQIKQKLLKQVKNTIRSLGKYQQQIETLKKEESLEENNYYHLLSQKLSEIGINSHEKLIRNCQEYLQSCDFLERTAILRHDLAWIDSKLENISIILGYLHQKEWKLSHFLKTDTPVATEEFQAINSLISTSQAIIDKQIPLPEAIEIGRLEQEIFNQIRKS